MKLILTVVMMVVVCCSTVRGDLEHVARPVLEMDKPLAEGVGSHSSGAYDNNFSALGSEGPSKSIGGIAVRGAGGNSIVDIVANVFQGVGGTVAAAPESLERVIEALQKNEGILGNLFLGKHHGRNQQQ